jgi:hypothetical protein
MLLLNFNSSGPRGSISPERAGGRLLKAADDLVDSPAGVAVGGFGVAGMRREIRVGDHLDRLVDVIEDDQFAVKAEEHVRDAAIVRRGLVEFLAFVIADGVVARVADQPAGEIRQALVAMEAAVGKQRLQVSQRIRGIEFPRAVHLLRDGGFPWNAV